MTVDGTTTKSGGPAVEPAAAALANVAAARARRARALASYRAAIVSAVSMLEADGARDAFAQVARAAGCTRQSVRELVGRHEAHQAD